MQSLGGESIMSKFTPMASILAAFLVVIFGFSSSASAVSLFLLEETTRNLYKIETDPLGPPTLIGSVAFGTDVVELVAVSQDRLYAFDRATGTLVVVDATNANVVTTVPLDRPFDAGTGSRGFDLSPDGILYGVFPDSSGYLELATIDPAAGITSFVAALTPGIRIEALAFSPDGTLFAVGTNPSGGCCPSYLYTIDPNTGVISQIGSMGIEVDTLDYASDRYLYGAQSGPGRQGLHQFEPSTGATTLVGDSGVNSIVGVTEEIRTKIIAVDISPRHDRPCVNQARVAIFGSADFDVTNINAETLMFGDEEATNHGPGRRCSLRDENGDGFLDLVCRFVPGSGEATIHGEFFDGASFEGTDSICVVR
jgi:hypothetical protein